MEASRLIWRAQQTSVSFWSPALPPWELLLRLVDRPPGWLVLAVVGSMSALGLAGASFIADFAETRAKPLHHKEEY